MNNYEVQHYTDYHKKDLQRQGAYERQARRAIANQTPVKRKNRNPLLLLIINLLNLMRGF